MIPIYRFMTQKRLIITKILLIVIISITMISVTSANDYWAKSFGGRWYDTGYDVEFTKNGNIVVLGTTKSFGAGENDFWLLFLDKKGNIKWQKTIGSSTDDYSKSIAVLPDGDIVVVGSTLLDFYYTWTVNMHNNGILKWEKIIKYAKDKHSLSGTPSKKMAILSNGNLVIGICEEFPSSYTSHIVCLDKDGNGKWSETVCGVCIKAVTSTNDDKIVIVGKTSFRIGFGGGDFYIALLDKNGNVLWQKIMGTSAYDEANSVAVTSNNKIIAVGYTESFGRGKGDAWLIKLDLKGNIIWQKAIGGDGCDGASDIDVMPNGDIVFVGGWRSFKDDGGYAWIVKLDSDGNIITQKTYSLGKFRSLDISNDGDIACVGYYYKSGILVMKLDNNLKIGNCTILRDTKAFIKNTDAIPKDINLKYTIYKAVQLEERFPAIKESNAQVLNLCEQKTMMVTTPVVTESIKTTTTTTTVIGTITPSVKTTREIPSSFTGLLTLLMIIIVFILRKI